MVKIKPNYQKTMMQTIPTVIPTMAGLFGGGKLHNSNMKKIHKQMMGSIKSNGK